MRQLTQLIWSLFLGLWFTLCLSSITYSYDCKIPLKDKICFSDNFDSKQCNSKANKVPLDEALMQLSDIMEYSPKIIQVKLCELEKIIIVEPKKDVKPYLGIADYDHIFLHSTLFTEGLDDDQTYLDDVMMGYKQFEKFSKQEKDKWLTDIADLYLEIYYPDDHISHLNYSLASTLYHELGHIIADRDFAADMFHCIKPAGSKLPFKNRGFHASSCTQQLESGLDSRLLKQLEKSIYPSLYATCNDGEYFAEVFTNHMMVDHFNMDFMISKRREPIYQQSLQYHQEKMKPYNQVIMGIIKMGEMNEAERNNAKLDHLSCNGPFKSN